MLALDRKSGKQLWQHEVAAAAEGPARKRQRPRIAESRSPTAANVYFFFQDFGLISYTADGKERWRMPLGPFNMFYGFGASPILEDGTLILSGRSGHRSVPARGRCEDRQGKVARRAAARDLGLLDADDLAAEDRRPAQILIPESFQLTAYSLADGKKLWWVRGLACEMKSVASIDDDTLYVNGWGFGRTRPARRSRPSISPKGSSGSTPTATASSAAMK